MFDRLTTGHRKVLEALVRVGTASRAELAEVSGYTRPAVTNIVRDLIDWGLVQEDNGAYAPTGRRGQPQKPVSLRAGAAYAFGVSFTAHSLDLVAMDLGGRVVGQTRACLPEPTPKAVLDAIQAQLESAYGKSHVARWRQLGFGVSVPGDLPAGYALQWNLGYRRDELSQYMAANLDAPVFIEPEPLACGMGERVFGQGAGYVTFLIVHIGLEIGGALFIDGKPLRSGQGPAGQIGQFFDAGSSPSGTDLLAHLAQAGFPTSLEGLDNLPEEARALIETWTARAAEQLSGALTKISRFVGPDAVVLTGRLPLLTELAARIDFGTGGPDLYASGLGPFQAAIGAASLPVFCHFLPQG